MQFVKNKNEEIEGVEGEETIKTYEFENSLLGFTQVLITLQPTDSNNEDYYNVYIICDAFQKEPLNCLDHQIPKESIKDVEEDFNRMFAEIQMLQKYLWFKYSTEKEIRSFGIEVFTDEID